MMFDQIPAPFQGMTPTQYRKRCKWCRASIWLSLAGLALILTSCVGPHRVSFTCNIAGLCLIVASAVCDWCAGGCE